jgi:ELP3 family radical SAM enzyme/protein acetyltransferase
MDYFYPTICSTVDIHEPSEPSEPSEPAEPTDIEDIISYSKHKNIERPIEVWDNLLHEFSVAKNSIKTKEDLDKFKKGVQKAYKLTLSGAELIKIYNTLGLEDLELKKLITKKKCKSDSGVLVITVLTSAHPEYTDEDGVQRVARFSCKHDCAYCPNEPAHAGNNWVPQPRSYLYSEPAVLRANDNKFDPILQMHSRINALICMGHIADKLEVIVLGGTWSEYPRQYQDKFITSLYYAANTFFDRLPRRCTGTLEEEITINETAKIHIIGLTLETRPDTITLEEIKNFRRYNCTRVQLGVQHTHNDVLQKINRGHNIQCVYDAIKLLKNNCFKVDMHIMPNLPGSSYEKDKEMLNEVLYDPRIQADQYKIYPTAIVPFTKIKKWYDEGSYVPYDDMLLFDLIKEFKKKVQKYKRLNRIIRDIPSHYIEAGYSKKFVNMRQLLQDDMRKNKWVCQCIRCREIKGNNVERDMVQMNVDKYAASDGEEYHISFDSKCEKNYLIGFLRLRILRILRISTNESCDEKVLPVLQNAALIRELHVYSNLNDVGNYLDNSMQHKGYGKQLVQKAEDIAKELGFHKIAIISGTGVRNYYRKLGYMLCDTYMIKELY